VRRLRILHIETRHRRGGAERNVLHTAKWQVRQGHAVTLAVGRDSIVEDLPGGIDIEVVPSLVRSIDPINDIRAVVALRRLVRRGRFDIVHTHQSKAGIVGRLAARGVAPSLVHTVHMASFGPAYGRLQSALFLTAERFMARSTEVIVSVGRELRDMYVASGVGDREKHVAIHSPIDIDHFAQRRTASDEARSLARARLGLPGDVAVVASISSLEPRKRVDLVIRELAEPLRTGRLALAVAGDGSERDALQRLIDQLSLSTHATLLGHVTDPLDLLLAADVLVHTSTVEGVPQVVIQGLAAGIPVVATSVIGLNEIADAPVLAVGPDAEGIRDAVEAVLREPPPTLPLEALGPWTAPVIEEQLRGLMDSLRVVGL
jgi:glycosyltransferase involved in cell wall biosynthesis